jgi:hypothetical protein
MEPIEKKIPNYVFEDVLFRRRLQRNVNDKVERLNRLLAEQVELLQTRKELLTEVNAAVLLRWRNEDDSKPKSENTNTAGANK